MAQACACNRILLSSVGVAASVSVTTVALLQSDAISAARK